MNASRDDSMGGVVETSERDKRHSDQRQSCSAFSSSVATVDSSSGNCRRENDEFSPPAYLINKEDGLQLGQGTRGFIPSEYYLNFNGDSSGDGDIMMHLSDVSDLPSSLIVTNIPGSVFVNEDCKNEFENLFKRFEASVNFEYFRTFKRCRVGFRTPEAATMARIHCDGTDFQGGFIRCFFAQGFDQKTPDENEELDRHHLKLPPLEKQFLISPPASPPVGWEPCRESEPIVNFELLSRLASLAHADAKEGIHELHVGGEDCPKIVIHTCEDSIDEEGNKIMASKLPQTRRPDFVSAGM